MSFAFRSFCRSSFLFPGPTCFGSTHFRFSLHQAVPFCLHKNVFRCTLQDYAFHELDECMVENRNGTMFSCFCASRQVTIACSQVNNVVQM